MRILELFDTGGEITQQLRQNALDVLTPFMAQKVPFVTVNQVIDGLKSNNSSGLAIDRSLVMELLDPEAIKAVDKIEGDRIYLSHPEADDREVDAEDQEKDAEHVRAVAQNQAAKQTQPQQPPPLPTPAA